MGGQIWTQDRLFALIFAVNLLTNFDSGALPGVLNQLRASPQLSPDAPSILGASARNRRALVERSALAPARHDRRGQSPLPPPSPPPSPRARTLPEQPAPCERNCHGFSLSYVECGVLGAIPYVALSLVAPWVGALLQRARVRRVLVVAVVSNGLACLAFGLAPSAWALLATRALVGVTQAFPFIFFPVWVDGTAGAANKTRSLSILQAGVPLGIFLGYLVGGLITSFLDTDHALVAGWRLPFVLQGGLLVPLGLAVRSVPEAMLEVGAEALPLASPRRRESDASGAPAQSAGARVGQTRGADVRGEGRGADGNRADGGDAELGVCAMLGELWGAKVYVCVLLCLSSIFFIVSGIQYWVTIFLIDHFHMRKGTVVLSFALVSSTGPILGVLGGGWLVDRAGGYGQHARCLRVLANYTVAGMALAVGIALVENALVVIVLIWALLVVGGAVLAPATGILLTAAPARVRTFGSAIATMAYNVLGYCLAPLLSGLVIEHYGIRWGFRFVVSIVALSCASLFAAIVAADAVDDAASAARARDAADVERSFALVRMLDGSFAVKAGKPASSARVDHLL